MATVQQLMAKLNRDVAGTLARNVRAMPPDKQTWQPPDGGRSALDQLQECAAVTAWAAQILRERAIPATEGLFERFRAECDTPDRAAARLEQEAQALAGVIESFPSDHLEDPVQLPWEEKPCSLAEAMAIAYWNNTYHLGQVCYIQTLYGDKGYY